MVPSWFAELSVIAHWQWKGRPMSLLSLGIGSATLARPLESLFWNTKMSRETNRLQLGAPITVMSRGRGMPFHLLLDAPKATTTGALALAPARPTAKLLLPSSGSPVLVIVGFTSEPAHKTLKAQGSVLKGPNHWNFPKKKVLW